MSEINFGAIATEWNRGGARRSLAELDRQGYVIVPKQLDDDMMEAAHAALLDAMSGIRPECLTEEIPLNILSLAVFDAAIAAAPKVTE